MKEMCQNLFEHLQPEAQLKNIRLINAIETQVTALADQHLTTIVLRNLISNAVKFTGKGGEIVVSSQEVTSEHNRLLKINVTDNGIGMSQERLETLFRIDKTVSTPGTENEKGTGLGLLLCKELLEKQGGQISATSVAGKGSIFIVTLPVTEMPD